MGPYLSPRTTIDATLSIVSVATEVCLGSWWVSIIRLRRSREAAAAQDPDPLTRPSYACLEPFG